jgi:large subunit ribosomal protein L29
LEKAIMKVEEIRELSVDVLRDREKELDDQLFRLRIQKSMGQLEAPAKVRDVRRDLARVKTILREKEAQ